MEAVPVLNVCSEERAELTRKTTERWLQPRVLAGTEGSSSQSTRPSSEFERPTRKVEEKGLSVNAPCREAEKR
ncbi:MAG: hypothetical protein DMG26_12855 [Acidobacteria bacterium]|nr:MAG: hypothetical protein DMG26_12855 [Acidobacteriota bacterium]